MNSIIMPLALVAVISLGGCTNYRDWDCPQTHQNQTTTQYKQEQHQQTYAFRSDELNTDDVRRVQRSLAREGFYNGRIDGIWGAQTSQAVLNYQTAHHGGQTGLSIETLQEFGVQIDRDRHNRI